MTAPNEWLPTALANPPGTAVIEDGDVALLEDGREVGPLRVLGPLSMGYDKKYPFVFGAYFWTANGKPWRGNNKYKSRITHVRKAVK